MFLLLFIYFYYLDLFVYVSQSRHTPYAVKTYYKLNVKHFHCGRINLHRDAYIKLNVLCHIVILRLLFIPIIVIHAEVTSNRNRLGKKLQYQIIFNNCSNINDIGIIYTLSGCETCSILQMRT